MREVMRVSNVDDKYVYLSLAISEAICSSCAIAGSCSIKGSRKEMKIPKNSIKKDFLPLMPGDMVIVDMKYNEAILSLIVYGIPLAGFIIGVLLGHFIKISDVISFIFGIAFAGIGAFFTRMFDKKYKIEVIDVKHQNLTDNFILQ